MATDLTGDLDVSREYNYAECPTAGIRDASNMWVFDDRGFLGLPRIAVEACAPGLGVDSRKANGEQIQWDEPEVLLNVAFADGRVFRLRESGSKHPVEGPDRKPTVLGAGPLKFRCVEPYRLWTASFQGTAVQTTTSALLEGNTDGPRVDLEFQTEATMAVPPWVMGSLTPQDPKERRIGGGLWGDPPQPGDEVRFEQLFRATGTLRVLGEEHTFNGSGLRIRRQGIRRLGGFNGHIWQSALFPSGKAFGFDCHASSVPGKLATSDGYIFTGDGALIPARVVKAPWLRTAKPKGDDVSLVLESELGITTIEGETVLSTFEVRTPRDEADVMGRLVLAQGGARYRWDGEETYGMIERSTARNMVESS
jgi:hypothetical protein